MVRKKDLTDRRTTIWIRGLCAKDACKLYGINYLTFSNKKTRSNKTPQEVFEDMLILPSQ